MGNARRSRPLLKGSITEVEAMATASSGKTYMSMYLVLNEGAMYDGQRIAVFDLVRSQQGPYGVFTSKTEVPHVVVFSNWPPDLKLSMDRWSVLFIDTESYRPSGRETVMEWESCSPTSAVTCVNDVEMSSDTDEAMEL